MRTTPTAPCYGTESRSVSGPMALTFSCHSLLLLCSSNTGHGPSRRPPGLLHDPRRRTIDERPSTSSWPRPNAPTDRAVSLRHEPPSLVGPGLVSDAYLDFVQRMRAPQRHRALDARLGLQVSCRAHGFPAPPESGNEERGILPLQARTKPSIWHYRGPGPSSPPARQEFSLTSAVQGSTGSLR